MNRCILLFSLIILVSCSMNSNTNEDSNSNNNTITGTPLDSIIQRGKLRVIVNNTPTSYFIYKGIPMGYQYDLMKRFCRDMNLELEIKVISSIPDAIDSLKERKADILAAGLTVLRNRKKEIDFSIPLTQTRQVLIQRKPLGYKKQSRSKIEKQLLRDVTLLAHQTVYVEEGSAYVKRMSHLQDEIGDSIHVVIYDGKIDIDSMMTLIDQGKVQYAVTDEYTAKFFLRYFPSIDIKTPISFNQNIAWAFPKNSFGLEDTINTWIKKNIHGPFGAVIYSRYFKHNKKVNEKANSSYNMVNGRISPYDIMIKNAAKKINWDWKLIAAQIAVESGFKQTKTSWAGAAGLMQIMPSTARGLSDGTYNIYDPHINIQMGVKLNGILFKYWISEIPDSTEAILFTLASYNIGRGHVYDAQRLASKFGLDPLKWEDNVADMIVKLSQSNYYNNEVVRHGYCRGIEARNYVSRITNLYANYNNFSHIENP